MKMKIPRNSWNSGKFYRTNGINKILNIAISDNIILLKYKWWPLSALINIYHKIVSNIKLIENGPWWHLGTIQKIAIVIYSRFCRVPYFVDKGIQSLVTQSHHTDKFSVHVLLMSLHNIEQKQILKYFFLLCLKIYTEILWKGI